MDFLKVVMPGEQPGEQLGSNWGAAGELPEELSQSWAEVMGLYDVMGLLPSHGTSPCHGTPSLKTDANLTEPVVLWGIGEFSTLSFQRKFTSFVGQCAQSGIMARN